MRTNVTVTSKGRFKHTISMAKRARRVKNVQYGFLEPMTHPRSGRLYANVAADNEFGVDDEEKGIHVPERPFWRPGTRKAAVATRDLAGRVDAATLTMSKRLATRIGIASVNIIKAEIASVNDPPNAPFTIKRKGFNDPLRETGGMMSRAITYRVGAASPAGTRGTRASEVYQTVAGGLRGVGQAFARVLGLGSSR